MVLASNLQFLHWEPFLFSCFCLSAALAFVGGGDLRSGRRVHPSRTPLRRNFTGDDEIQRRDDMQDRPPLQRTRTRSSPPPLQRRSGHHQSVELTGSSLPPLRRHSTSQQPTEPSASSPSRIRRRVEPPQITEPTALQSITDLPYVPLNPLEPPITVFAYPFSTRQHDSTNPITDNPIEPEPTSPISSRDALSPPDKRPKSPSLMAPTSDRSKDPFNQPSLLRTKSLPTSRRRRHHHGSRAHREITAPITFTPLLKLHLLRYLIIQLPLSQHRIPLEAIQIQ